jgi:signal transduction histidine kinase
LEQIESDGVETPTVTSEHQFQALRVEATRVELLLAVIRILQWMVQRKHRVPTGTKQEIFVSWSEHGENTSICLEDRSARLSHRWRQFLFEPFAQAAAHGDWKYVAYESESRGESSEGRTLTAGRYLPLYLAKMLVELKNGGQLTDETEAMPGERGHRFVMTFPRQTAQLTSFAA